MRLRHARFGRFVESNRRSASEWDVRILAVSDSNQLRSRREWSRRGEPALPGETRVKKDREQQQDDTDCHESETDRRTIGTGGEIPLPARVEQRNCDCGSGERNENR